MSGPKGLARKALDKVTPGQHLTKAPGPRVLILEPSTRWVPRPGNPGASVPLFEVDDLSHRLRRTVPTVDVVSRLSEVNLNEYDCLITSQCPLDITTTRKEGHYPGTDGPEMHAWKQVYPTHLSVVCLVPSGGLEVLDASPAEAEPQSDLPSIAIVRDPKAVGRHLRKVEGLTESLAHVVKSELLPVARSRDEHQAFRRWVSEKHDAEDNTLALTPFMLGPDDIVLAGSYHRNDEASVWLLPEDLPDLYPWVVQALREWHDLYPERFPSVPDWQTSPEWHSSAEATVAAAREAHRSNFFERFEQYQREQADFEQRSEQAKARASNYHRALLTEDSDALAEAVACALADLGFHVVDMDEHWTNGDRREDLRVFDESDPEWVAIVEVKGSTGGAKETEVQNFGRWAERFILDEGRKPDARWFVTNHQRRLDPSAREGPFANKSAVAATFAKSDGCVLDTRALFDLLRLVEAEPTLDEGARNLLKSKPSVLVRVTARDLSLAHADVPAEREHS